MGLRLTDNNKLWIDGLIPYEIDNGDFPSGSAERQIILDAIKIVNDETNVTFTPRNGDADFVNFKAADESCGTNTGRSAGENAIQCNVLDFGVGSVVHEMCHEMGIHHEQVREDRDSFVTISWSKIKDGKCHNFKRKVTPEPANYNDCADTYDPATQTLLTTDVGSYDYNSLMHYGKTGFRKDSESGNTLTPTNPSTASIGQRDGLSDGDLATINSMYATDSIYLRDNLEDNGEEPLSGGGISQSPDIIHVTTEAADPQATFGTAAAMALGNLSDDVEFGQTNFVYVRLQKNGTLVDNADVDLYWTPASTLPSPDLWTQIGGTVTESNISPGETRIVGPFLFNNVPAEGHYCFVAVVNSRKNPAPNLDEINTSTDFIELVRNKSNMAWKNFDVIDVEEGGDMEMDFVVSSMKFESTDNALEFDLSELPSNIDSEIRIIKRLGEHAVLNNLSLDSSGQIHNIYKGAGNTNIHSFSKMTFKSRDQTIVRLKVHFPDNVPHGAYDIHVKQLKGNTEFGRVTRRINIGKFPFIGNARTRELHRANCPWIPKMSPENKVAFTDMNKGLGRGYDGCHTCLLEHDTG